MGSLGSIPEMNSENLRATDEFVSLFVISVILSIVLQMKK